MSGAKGQLAQLRKLIFYLLPYPHIHKTYALSGYFCLEYAKVFINFAYLMGIVRNMATILKVLLI